MLGCPLESNDGASRSVYDTFEYVSLRDTFSSLLQNWLYGEALLQDKCEPGILVNFSDGSRYIEHLLIGDCQKFSMMIQPFRDGLGVT
jgi:hypothetical protein